MGRVEGADIATLYSVQFTLLYRNLAYVATLLSSQRLPTNQIGKSYLLQHQHILIFTM